jgi:hypothetical protein
LPAIASRLRLKTFSITFDVLKIIRIRKLYFYFCFKKTDNEYNRKRIISILYQGVNTLNAIKSTIDSKFYDFNRDRDKLDFIKILYDKTIKAKKKHPENCTCDFDESHNIGLFTIEQEIESINKYYKYEPKSHDSFTIEQESKMHAMLNEITDNLKKLGYGQEIIFNEIDELKGHFDIGKHNWFQLLKGKLFDIGLAYGVEKLILEGMYSDLAREVDNV